MNSLLSEAIEYFKQEMGFHRLLNKLIEKYRGLGRIGGSVTLQSLTSQEREVLSQFFRQDYSKQKSVTITFERFSAALQWTKFSSLSVKEILDGYFGSPILSRGEEEETKKLARESFFHELLHQFIHPYCQLWLQHINSKGKGTRGINHSYERDAEGLREKLIDVLSVLNQLPIQHGYERIPLFASRITGDPHRFDPDREQGRLFIQALQIIREDEDSGYVYISSPSAEQIAELYQYFGLVRDDILNFVTCTGLIAYDQADHALPLWEEACRSKSVMNVPLRELIKVAKCFPNSSVPCTSVKSRNIIKSVNRQQIVFVVENSGVFSSILDRIHIMQAEQETTNEPGIPALICTHGQFKLASLLLIDKLIANGIKIYYSGDFDPEGLQMAERLLQRHPKHVQLWRYDVEDFGKCKYGLKVALNKLNKLKSITHPALIALAHELLQRRMVKYQEGLIDVLVEDIFMGGE